MHKNNESEDQKTTLTDYKIEWSIQPKGYRYYSSTGGDYDYVSQE